MSDKELAEFAPLWGSKANEYVLVDLEPARADLTNCGIFNRQHKSMLLIEDAELALEVMHRMADAGVEIVNKFPLD